MLMVAADGVDFHVGFDAACDILAASVPIMPQLRRRGSARTACMHVVTGGRVRALLEVAYLRMPSQVRALLQ